MTTVAVHQLLNTLFITAQGAYAHVDHETIKVELDGETQLQVPVHHIGAVVCFGNVMVSPVLIHRCAEDGRALVFMGQDGRFKARIVGPISGNVLLRQAQYSAQRSPGAALDIARNIVAGKIQNSRSVVMRGARQAKSETAANALHQAAGEMAAILRRLERSVDINEARGYEGEAADAYFRVLKHLILVDGDYFSFDGRNRRPPRDAVNALLSFVYALLCTDCTAAAEGVGLDPQIGFLHSIRPGRPGLALDLMEELRPALADRLALTLINRQQLTAEHFEQRTGGAVLLNEKGRKILLVAYQKRKQEEVRHAVIDRSLPFGLVPHVQARLLARYLRDDIDHYLPYLIQ